MRSAFVAAFVLAVSSVTAFACVPLEEICDQQTNGQPYITDQYGRYHGTVNDNQFDPNSIANPFGKYGSQFSPDSINNQFGAGSPFSPNQYRVVPGN
jgi:hypothetical protein